MNPRGGEQLSQPDLPVSNGVEQYGNNQEKSAETPLVSPESNPSKASAPVIVPVNPIAILDQPTPVLPVQDDSATATSSNTPYSHSEKIEKQWLDRAKSVATLTKDDPFKQKSEMSKVKAEYIEKRFNKKIKIDDAGA